MWYKIINNYVFTPSTRKNKKYDVYDNTTKKYLTSFGDKRYQGQFYDDERRERYLKRHKKDYKLAGIFSRELLW